MVEKNYLMAMEEPDFEGVPAPYYVTKVFYVPEDCAGERDLELRMAVLDCVPDRLSDYFESHERRDEANFGLNDIFCDVLFPTSDPVIASRGGHINTAHQLFAIWNAAHLLARNRGLHDLLAIEVTSRMVKIIEPDTPTLLGAGVYGLRDRHRAPGVTGLFNTFFTVAGELCSFHSVRFVAMKQDDGNAG